MSKNQLLIQLRNLAVRFEQASSDSDGDARLAVNAQIAARYGGKQDAFHTASEALKQEIFEAEKPITLEKLKEHLFNGGINCELFEARCKGDGLSCLCVKPHGILEACQVGRICGLWGFEATPVTAGPPNYGVDHFHIFEQKAG